MSFLNIKVTKKKNGQEVAWFRDSQGRVRTRQGSDWMKAAQVRELADYGILLQLEQAARGLGSDGTPMPPLKSRRQSFAGRRNGVATFQSKTIRNLSGPGKDGHMLDDIRVNYVDDRRATFAITRRSSRIKALANETKAPWYGWSPASMQKLTARAAEIFNTGMAEYLVSVGLISAGAALQARGVLRRVA